MRVFPQWRIQGDGRPIPRLKARSHTTRKKKSVLTLSCCLRASCVNTSFDHSVFHYLLVPVVKCSACILCEWGQRIQRDEDVFLINPAGFFFQTKELMDFFFQSCSFSSTKGQKKLWSLGSGLWSQNPSSVFLTCPCGQFPKE